MTSDIDEDVLPPTLLEDFLSGDVGRVLHAVWQVFATRDPEVLEPLVTALPTIERATDGLELGGALVANGKNLRHALDRVRLVGEHRCLCVAYTDHPFYEPATEEAAGHVQVVEEIPVFFNGRPERPRRVCACTDCGQRFDVEEGESHYPWWRWTVLS